jgi:broad specificity phosphatase PhoE
VPTRLLLVRHGQIDANLQGIWHGSTDSPLTAVGHAQAASVAAHLLRACPTVAAIYTSPLQRARDTADAIARAYGQTVIADPRLAEYGIGTFEGERFDDLSDRHRFFDRAFGDRAWAPPGGESVAQVTARVLAAWRTIVTAHPDGTVIAVTHGAAIATGLATLLHDDPAAWQNYHVRNTSRTELHLEPVPRLVAFNQIDHLS